MKLKYNLSIITLFLLLSVINGCYSEYMHIDQKDLKSKMTKSFNTSANDKVIIEMSLGNIMVTTWDKDELFINLYGTDNLLDKMNVNFEQKDNNTFYLSVKRKNEFSGWLSGVGARIEIKVPKKYNVKAETKGGDIRFAGLDGNLAFSTSGGDISSKQCLGNISCSTSGGDILLDSTSGNLNFSTSGGDIKVIKTVNSNLNVSTSGGDINLLAESTSIVAETSGGDINVDFRGENKGISLETSGGDILLTLAPDINATAEITTSGGEVSSEVKINNATKVSSKEIKGDFNNGGNLIHAHTSGGDVLIKTHKR